MSIPGSVPLTSIGQLSDTQCYTPHPETLLVRCTLGSHAAAKSFKLLRYHGINTLSKASSSDVSILFSGRYPIAQVFSQLYSYDEGFKFMCNPLSLHAAGRIVVTDSTIMMCNIKGKQEWLPFNVPARSIHKGGLGRGRVLFQLGVAKDEFLSRLLAVRVFCRLGYYSDTHHACDWLDECRENSSPIGPSRGALPPAPTGSHYNGCGTTRPGGIEVSNWSRCSKKVATSSFAKSLVEFLGIRCRGHVRQ